MTARQRAEREFREIRERGLDLLPPSLVPVFNETFVGSCLLYEEFTYRLALEVLRKSGLEPHLDDPAGLEEIIARAGLDPLQAPVPLGWILRLLSNKGAIEIESEQPGDDGSGHPSLRAWSTRVPGEPERLPGAPPSKHGPRFRLAAPLPALDSDEPMREQRELDPSWMVSYEIARVAARGYPDFLKGKLTGETVLFAPEPLGLWFEYFSNRNGLYVVNNIVGACAAAERLPGGGGLRILELGGGLGSAALALLERLEETGRLRDIDRYQFTELQPGFLRRGQRALADRFGGAAFLAGSRLDMNRPFGEQGVAEGTVSLVYAVNTLHVARDLGFTLGEIHRSLAPGGAVVLSECIRPFPGLAIYAEFVFNLMETFRAPVLDPRFRPNGGFLTPEQWAAALLASGFEDVRFVPDILKIRERYKIFFVAAVTATRGR